MDIKTIFKEYILISIGCLLLACGINFFYLPINLVTGGFSGLSIIISGIGEKFGINLSLWLLNLLLNLPFFIIAYFVLGKSFIIKSAFATIMLSIGLYITALFPFIETDYILSSIFGGVFSGLGLGIVFRYSATTGGTDLVSVILKKIFFKNMNVSKILMVLDSLIVCFGFFIFGATSTMYAIVAIFVTTKAIDNVLEGLNFAKAVFILSDYNEAISNKISEILNRGVTGIYSKGLYKNEDKMMLMTVVSKKEVIKLKDITSEIDKKAFVIVTDVREVLGEGFTI